MSSSVRAVVAALGGAAAAVTLAGVLAACGGGGGAESGDGPSASGRSRVVASFYPLAYAVQRIGGDRVLVTNLTPPGAEPHDLELSPQDVGGLQDAVLVTLGGFQPAVDDAAAQLPADRVVDVAPAVDLDLTYTPIEGGEAEADEAGATDPHFWLDPRRFASAAAAIEQRLAELDPHGATTYAQGLADLEADLAALDAEFAAGLASCASDDLVTSHNSFGYLARRYGLTQVGITGLTPEAEPAPAALAAVAQYVEDNDVRTVYSETLVSPAVAETIAAETGATTAVLDPLEGLGEESQGRDYLEVMRTDLATLRVGQSCQ